MHLVRLLFAGAALAAAALIGCSGDPPSAQRVDLTSEMSPGTNSAASCPVPSLAWITIDNSGASVDNGGTSAGEPVSVSCQVTSNSDGSFNVDATASILGEQVGSTGTPGGSIHIVGKFTPAPSTVSNVAVTFQRPDFGAYTETDCTVSYGANQGVAAGRVWASVSCPKATNTSGTKPLVCAGQATFKFENCNQ